MKLYRVLSLLAISIIINGCGPDYGVTGSAEIQFEVNEDVPVDDFKVKKAIALKRKEPHPNYHDYEIIIANYYIAIGPQGTILAPSTKGDVAFVIDLDHPEVGKNKAEYMVWVYTDNANYCLSGEKWGCNLDDFHGDLIIKELDDEHISGSINYVHKTGAHLKSTFDVPIQLAK